MTWIGLAAGGGGCLLTWLYAARVDAAYFAISAKLRHHATRLFAAPPTVDEDLLLVGRLLSSLRAGISLDAALESAALDAAPASAQRGRLQRILDGNAGADFLSSFLAAALATGAPLLLALQGIEKALLAKRRLTLRAHAATAQCRAQADVLSWLPWCLGTGVALMDSEWFGQAVRHPLAWFLWALALTLTGLGRHWMRRSLKRALSPRGELARWEENVLPDFLLRLLAAISQGLDLESVTEKCLHDTRDPSFPAFFLAANPARDIHRVARLKGLLAHAARTGAPLREELLSFLADLQNELEARWEERVQKLPIALLAPLFVCFFPSSLLMLCGLLFPLLLGAL